LDVEKYTVKIFFFYLFYLFYLFYFKAKHISPEEAHDLLSNPPPNLVILDTRNYYESRIGYFKNDQNQVILPNIRKFEYFYKWVDKKQDLLKDKNIFMYCTGKTNNKFISFLFLFLFLKTGGIRCEKASAYVKNKGICENVVM
jgi:UPF0176 protein